MLKLNNDSRKQPNDAACIYVASLAAWLPAWQCQLLRQFSKKTAATTTAATMATTTATATAAISLGHCGKWLPGQLTNDDNL